MNKRVLIVAPDFPYPPNHGGRADMFSRMLALFKSGHDIDLLVSSREALKSHEKNKILEIVSNLIVDKREKGITRAISTEPYQIRSRAGLAKVNLKGKHYDAVVLEGEYVFQILKNKTFSWKKCFLRVHNNEFKYFLSLAGSAGKVSSIYYYAEALRFKFFLKNYYSKVDSYLYISKLECDKSGIKDKQWLPPAVQGDMKSYNYHGNQVIFVGSLFMPNNLWGLKWYLNNVHGYVLQKTKGYKLVIAGNTKGSDFSWLNDYEGLDFFDTPHDEDLKKLYSESSLFIAPVFHGAGVKLKCINAIEKGLPVITTSVGNEGTGLKNKIHIAVNDDVEGFAESIVFYLKNKEEAKALLDKAQEFVRKEYSEEKTVNAISKFNDA